MIEKDGLNLTELTTIHHPTKIITAINEPNREPILFPISIIFITKDPHKSLSKQMFYHSMGLLTMGKLLGIVQNNGCFY